MMYLYILPAVILLAGIDAIRIHLANGLRPNINHIWSGVLMIVVIVIGNYVAGYDNLKDWLIFTGYAMAVREAIYSPFLNIFRGKNWNYESPTTSSFWDNLLDKFSFITIRLVSVVIAIILALIHYA